jgi:hypothetical protein
MKKYVAPLILVVITLFFFRSYFIDHKVPLPADALVGLYHPFRDTIADEYPNGIPYKNYLITDPIRQQYPWRYLAIESLKQGKLSFWNPSVLSGTPLAGNLQSASFYPLNILFFVMPFIHAWSVLVILQPILAGLFMYLFLRKRGLVELASFFGGIVYAFCGTSIVWLEWNTIGHVMVWLPFVLYIKEFIIEELSFPKLSLKRLTLLFVLLLLVEVFYLLAGHIQTAFYVWTITVIYLFWRLIQINKEGTLSLKRLFLLSKLFIIEIILLLIITAVQYIPFIQFLLNSARGVDQANWQKEGWFIPLQHLVQFVAPDFFGNPATLNYWGTWNYAELVGYVGIFPLIFAGIALFFVRNSFSKVLGGILLFCFLFATSNPISRFIYQTQIPFLSSAQPTRLLGIIDFCLAVLSAIGLNSWIQNKVDNKRIAVWVGSIGTVVVLMLWGIVLTNIFNIPIENIQVAKRNLIFPSMLIGLSIFVAVIELFSSSHKKLFRFNTIIPFIVIGITVVDLFRFGWKFTPFSNALYVYPKSSIITYLQKQEKPFRIMTTDDRILPPNVSAMYGIETVEGYDPLYSSDYGELMSAWVKGKPDVTPISFNRLLVPHDYKNPLANLLNVNYILTFDEITDEGYELVFQERTTRLYKNNHSKPRAYFAERVAVVHSENEAIAELFTSTNTENTAVVYADVTVEDSKITDSETVTITDYSSEIVIIETKSDYNRMLVLSDSYYPTWDAFIDNIKTPIFKTNYAFRGILVPAGTHKIVFKNSLW